MLKSRSHIQRAMLVAPLGSGLVILLSGLFTPGYSHLHQAISELAAPMAPLVLFVQCIGFVPLAIVFLFFALDLARTRQETHLVIGLFAIWRP